MKKYKLNLKASVIFFLLWMTLSTFLFAQKPNYKFKSINQPDGLINSTIQVIFEDSFGFIWLGTHHGVQRYDGKTYKNYIHNNIDSNGLSKNYINGFCEDSDRNIWIITSAGLNKYDRKTDRISRYKWHTKFMIKYDEPNLLSIFCDDADDKILWLTGVEVGLIKLNIQNDSIAIYSLSDKNEKLSTWILSYPGNKNKLLLGSTKLSSFDKTTGQFDDIFKLEQNAEIPNNLINDAVIDPANQDVIWLATGDYWGRGSLGGLIQYNLNTGSMINFSPDTRKEDMPDRHLLCLYFTDKDHLWIGTRYASALLYNRKEKQFYNFRNNEYDKGSFSSDYAVRSIIMDKSGTLWFGSWGDGISLLSPTAQKFSRYIHLPQNVTGLPDNYINTFTEDKYGNIWIGTKAGGLSKFNPRQKTFENYFRDFASSITKPTEITYLYYDSHENLWIGTYDDALYRYSPDSGIKIHYRKGTSKNEVSQNRISAITELKPGEILISTYGGGLNIYSYNTDSFRQFSHNPKDSASIPDYQIWLPFMGQDGNYYFSGNSIAGLIQFNPVTEKFVEIIPRGSITTFMMPSKTSDGRIFINDVAEGLREIIFKNEIIVNTLYDIYGNTIKNIESILIDDGNKLWLGTGNGLLKYDPDNKSIKRYDSDDGLQGFEFNRFAAFKSLTGEMYFGGKNGFSVFDPEAIDLSNYEPPVVLTGLRIFQEEVTIGEGSPLKQNILLTNMLVLNHDQNDFSISFAALDFSNPHKILYKYKLVNHDNDWIDAGNFSYAGYTNMDPGTYTFMVKSSNADGVWNDKITSLEIIIHAPWWQTTAAYIGYGLILIIVVFVIDRFQRKRLKEKARAQAREKELAQAKEIEKAYVELKNAQKLLIQSEKMASLGELTAGIAHEIQNPLNFVNNFAEISIELIDELKQESAVGSQQSALGIIDDIRQNLEKIDHHGKRADSIVKGMLQHSRTSSGQKVPTDINTLADEYLRLAYHGLRAKDKSFNATMKTDFDESIGTINIIPQDIGRVILNLITNAFYAVDERKKQLTSDLSSLSNLTGLNHYEPTVTVSTGRSLSFEGESLSRSIGGRGEVVISVKDNGNGIPQKNLDKIFQPFFTTKPTGQGTGLGLSLSYDIVKAHGGELKVVTQEGIGTEFIIVLPSSA